MNDLASTRPAAAEPKPPVTFAVSIVSHGQGDLVAHLLDDFRRRNDSAIDLIVTLNRPEPEGFLRHAPASTKILRNARPKGFGANHNQAFRQTDAPYFVVLNPDIRLMDGNLCDLVAHLDTPSLGALAPQVVNRQQQPEDHARRFPSVFRIAARVLRRASGGRNRPDYDLVRIDELLSVDWVAGMFVVFPREAFEAVGGFDEAYFMYLEDADICARLHHRGFRVVVSPAMRVIHDARRASMKSAAHFRWHVSSMVRFLTRRVIGS